MMKKINVFELLQRPFNCDPSVKCQFSLDILPYEVQMFLCMYIRSSTPSRKFVCVQEFFVYKN